MQEFFKIQPRYAIKNNKYEHELHNAKYLLRDVQKTRERKEVKAAK